MAQCLLGIDIGTSVIKSALLDLSGAEIAVSQRDATLLHPQANRVELDMEAVWQAVVETLGRTAQVARAMGHTVAAIGVTGQGDGTWLVDAAGNPVRNAITWLDGRTGELVGEAYSSGLSQAVFAITGTALNTANQALHLRWLQDHETQSLARAAAALRAKDWVFLRLTGVVGSDESDASHTYFDVAARRFAPQLLDLLGITRWAHLIPPARPAHENVAPLLGTIAETVGLPVDTPVVAGPFDVPASALAVGVIQPGDACTILGTAGIHQTVISKPVAEPQNVGYTLAHGPADRLLRLLPTMTGTLNLQWFAREFFAHEMADAEANGKDFWDQAEALAQSVPLGCDGVLYHPYIDAAGERAPFVRPDARAQFSGMSSYHTRAVLLRAVYEGVALSALDCYQTLGAPIRVLKLTGGGARSAFWAQMFADALSCPVQTMAGRESGARGAAIAAGVAVGIFASYEQGVESMVRVSREFAPNLRNGALYFELLGLYRNAYAAAQTVWEERAAWRKRNPWKETS